MPFIAILVMAVGMAFSHLFTFVRDQSAMPILIVGFLCLICGFTVGIVGIFKCERLHWLAFTGVLLNLGFIVFAIGSMDSNLFLGGLTENAWALISPDAPSNHLPKKVRITIDGACATFNKGSFHRMSSSLSFCGVIQRKILKRRGFILRSAPAPDAARL